jgi:hypothetical protein
MSNSRATTESAKPADEKRRRLDSSAVVTAERQTDISYYPSCCAVKDEANHILHYVGFSTDDDAYDSLNDEGATIRILCRAIQNLSRPIKLISKDLVFKLGYFPCYHKVFEFEQLTTESMDRCISISHRWTDEMNHFNSCDVEWLQENWSNIKDVDKLPQPVLFFYDFTSLPQKLNKSSLDREDRLTFKAGLELIDHLFSRRSIIIPTYGYLFRYWCYVEFFIMEYHQSKLTGVPFVDVLPRDLAIIDMALRIMHKAIVRPDQQELKIEIQGLIQWKVCSLGEKTAQDIRGAIVGMLKMTPGTKKTVLGIFLRHRQNIVNMIRSRLRQCSLTVREDEAYLQTVLAHYLDHAPVSFDELQGTEYVEWDGKAADEKLVERFPLAQSPATPTGDRDQVGDQKKAGKFSLKSDANDEADSLREAIRLSEEEDENENLKKAIELSLKSDA